MLKKLSCIMSTRLSNNTAAFEVPCGYFLFLLLNALFDFLQKERHLENVMRPEDQRMSNIPVFFQLIFIPKPTS